MAKALQVVPTEEDYVFQANHLSRATYQLPVMQRRLLYLAIAQARPTDDSLPCIEMNVGDIVRALGLSDQGNRYEEVRAAARGLRGSVLETEGPDGWVIFGWVDRARYIKTRDAVQIELSQELRPYVLNLQKAFTVLKIADVARLQSKYALRLFELVMSYQGHAGKGGNKAREWYVDLEFAHLRQMLKIGAEEYTGKNGTNAFRKWVIDIPLREINEAAMGLHLEADYQPFRRGRRLLGVRLRCRLLAQGDPRPVDLPTEDDLTAESLGPKDRARFAEILAEVKANGELFPLAGYSSPFMREQAQTAEALSRLKAEGLAAGKVQRKR